MEDNQILLSAFSSNWNEIQTSSNLVELMEREKIILLSAGQEKKLEWLEENWETTNWETLTALVKDQVRGKKRRAESREVLLAHLEVKSKFKIMEKAGRPCLQENQPMLLQTIIVFFATCKKNYPIFYRIYYFKNSIQLKQMVQLRVQKAKWRIKVHQNG